MPEVKDSILDTTKKILGLDADYTAFDLDIITHINSVFFTLQQLGVGPKDGYHIIDNTASWTIYLGVNQNLNAVKSYLYMRVRLLFDPPSTSYAIESMNKQAQELEWRLNVYSEGVKHPWETPSPQ